MALKVSQEFPTASLDITEDFHILLTQCLRIHLFFHPQSKNIQMTHTHAHAHAHTHARARASADNSNIYKQKATGHVTSFANGYLTGSDAPFVRKIPTASSDKKKKELILLTLDWLCGRPQTLIQRRHVNGTKRTPSQNWGNLLSELQVPHEHCVTGISDAFFFSFLLLLLLYFIFLPVSVHLHHGFTVPSTKACLLCATPAGTYRVQFHRFPKIVY